MPQSPLTTVILPVTPFQQNCSLLWCSESHKGALLDPGGESERLIAAVSAKQVEIEKILLTHGHIDHAGAAAQLARHYGVPIEGPHAGDRSLLNSLAEQGSRFGFSGAENCLPSRWLNDEDSVELGAVRLRVRHCPGHTPGHVIFYAPQAALAFVGDVLFRGSIGRTDLPGGDFNTLIGSITERLWPLGDDTNFVPGHGPMSSFGWERKTNPFVSDLALGRA